MGQRGQRNAEQVVQSEDSEQNIESEVNEGPPLKRASLVSAHRRASGFNLSWQKGHPWPVHNKEQGMFCTLCTRSQEMEADGVWVSKGCMSFHYNKIKAHEQCVSHKEAERDRAAKAASENSGGIRAALQEAMSEERRAVIGAVIGALKCMYFLTKKQATSHYHFL